MVSGGLGSSEGAKVLVDVVRWMRKRRKMERMVSG
jgi:hypothetical protein